MCSFYDDTLLKWVEILVGLDKVRVQDAARHVDSWKIAHVNQEFFTRPSVDSAIAVTQLCGAVLSLERAGTPRTKLLAKLRRDKDVWPTWAELRAAALLLQVTTAQIHLEVNRNAGRHSDFTLSLGESVIPVEFKAVGLSDEEATFCRRVGPALDGLLPPKGLLTFHAPLDVAPLSISVDQLPGMHAAAAAAAAKVTAYPPGLSGVTIVGHGGEANYARRVRSRLVNEIAQQVPQVGGSWAAFYWTNGAPTSSLLRTLVPGDFPHGLAGVILLGDAVAFPNPAIHSFVFVVPTGAEGTIVRSEIDDKFASRVLRRFEASSGVRADLLSVIEEEEKRELIRRDGTRRILPFNLLMDSDPIELSPKGQGPDWNTDRVRAGCDVE